MKDLKRRMRRKGRFWPGRFDLSKLRQIGTVREFDEAYTAPYFGFAGAEDYYHRASAMRIVERIRVPALVITADDDPFVPSQPFHDAKLTGNPRVTRRRLRARRPLRLRRPGLGRRRRLLGRKPDRGVRRLPPEIKTA